MKDFLKNLKLNEGNISLGLGVTVMLVAGVMLFNYFKSMNTAPGNNLGIINAEEKISSASTEVIEETPNPLARETSSENIIAAITPTPVPVVVNIEANSEYTVQKNDSLWKISVRTYGKGDNWTKIYEANKATLGKNPGVISAGTKIKLPKIETIAQATTPEIVQAQPIIAEHKVNPGDNLWTIVHNACGTGFVYPAIAQQNNIANPRIIQPGMVIKMICPVRKQAV